MKGIEYAQYFIVKHTHTHGEAEIENQMEHRRRELALIINNAILHMNFR